MLECDTYEPRDSPAIATLSATAFEEYIAALFRKHGHTATLTPLTGEKGIDIILTKDGQMTVVQVKHYAPTRCVTFEEVLAFHSNYSFNPRVRGILVTPSYFSASTVAWAKEMDVELVNGTRLAAMIEAAL